MHTVCFYIYIVYKRQCFVPVRKYIQLALCFCCEPTPICGMHISVWHFPIYGPCVTRIQKTCLVVLSYTWKAEEGEGNTQREGVGEGHGTKISKKNQRWAQFIKKASIRAIPTLYFQRKVSIKRFCRFKPLHFKAIKRLCCFKPLHFKAMQK